MRAKILRHSNKYYDDYANCWKYVAPTYDVKIKTFLFYVKVAELDSQEEAEAFLKNIGMISFKWRVK